MKSQFALCLMAISSFFLTAAPVESGSVLPRSLPNPIVTAIHKLQPSLDNKKTLKLANMFARASYEHEIPWQILVSIAFNESSMGIHILNEQTRDSCMMQINEKTALRYGLSPERLLKDEAYCIAAACKVLSDNKTMYAKKLSYWLGLYRSGTRLNNPRIRENAKRYDQMIRLTAATIGYK